MSANQHTIFLPADDSATVSLDALSGRKEMAVQNEIRVRVDEKGIVVTQNHSKRLPHAVLIVYINTSTAFVLYSSGI